MEMEVTSQAHPVAVKRVHPHHSIPLITLGVPKEVNLSPNNRAHQTVTRIEVLREAPLEALKEAPREARLVMPEIGRFL